MRELGSFLVLELERFSCPKERAQYDLRRLAALLPFLTLPVTAVFSLLPGFAFRYARTPFAVIPAPFLVER